MAGYSENREMSLEIKYLRKVLGAVETPMPASLRGEELIKTIEHIPEPKSSMELFFPKKWLNLRSGFAYAAAFLLIVCLSYGLGRNRNNIVMGELSLQPGESTGSAAPKVLPEEDKNPVVDGTPFAAPAQDKAWMAEEPQTADTPNPDAGEPLAVGGNPAIRLGTMGEYTLVYRSNEGNPEEMADAPYALEVLHGSENVVMSRVNIPEMADVAHFYLEGTQAVLVGSGGDASLIFSVDLSDPANPVKRPLITQAGTVLGARVYDGVLHVVSYLPDYEVGIQSTIELPDSAEEGACIITALDLATGEWAQEAFLGAGPDTQLYRINAYVYFNQQIDGEEFPTLRLAKIRLNGLQFELEDIT